MKILKKWLNNHPELKRTLEGGVKLGGLIVVVGVLAYLIQKAAHVLNIL